LISLFYGPSRLIYETRLDLVPSLPKLAPFSFGEQRRCLGFAGLAVFRSSVLRRLRIRCTRQISGAHWARTFTQFSFIDHGFSPEISEYP
jgi:hypothetical protein